MTLADSPHFDKAENLFIECCPVFIVHHLTIQFSARCSVTESICVPAAATKQLCEWITVHLPTAAPLTTLWQSSRTPKTAAPPSSSIPSASSGWRKSPRCGSTARSRSATETGCCASRWVHLLQTGLCHSLSNSNPNMFLLRVRALPEVWHLRQNQVGGSSPQSFTLKVHDCMLK